MNEGWREVALFPVRPIARARTEDYLDGPPPRATLADDRGHGVDDPARRLASNEGGRPALVADRRPASGIASRTDDAGPEQIALDFEASPEPRLEHGDVDDRGSPGIFSQETCGKGALYARLFGPWTVSPRDEARGKPTDPADPRGVEGGPLPRGITRRPRATGPDVYLLSWTDERGRLRQEQAGSDLDEAVALLEQRRAAAGPFAPGARVRVALPLALYCGADEEPGSVAGTFLRMASGPLASSVAVVRFDALPLGWPRAAGCVALVAVERVTAKPRRGLALAPGGTDA